MNNVWLVTGSASRLGRIIAEAVLESDDRLVATARDTKRLDDLVKKYGDRVRAVPLDVTDESAAQATIDDRPHAMLFHYAATSSRSRLLSIAINRNVA
jgi:NADP-dependent 3-hydroxy acid dehydrogenase YdfG